MEWWEKLATSLKRVFERPETQYLPQANWASQCNLWWSYYANSMFDKFEQDTAALSKYKETYDLYRFTRMLYNPTRRLVDFYVGSIYPGLLSPTGDRRVGGQLSAIPFNKKTSPQIKTAVSQFWIDSNFQSLKALICRYTAATGVCLVEVLDLVDKRMVVCDVVWPGHVTSITLDKMGNVKKYTLSYQIKDEEGNVVLYRKMVDNVSIREYYGDELRIEILHGYTFCPAVWYKHVDEGSAHAVPAIQGSIPKIDELNSLAAHACDLTHKIIESPMIFWTDGTIRNVLGATNIEFEGDDFGPDPSNSQQAHMLLKGPKEGRVDTLAPKVELQATLEQMKGLIGEIEADHPEITMYRELRSMAQVSGPSVARLVNDTVSKATEPSANADRQTVKLFQMVLAISGERANTGDWGPVAELTEPQRKFLPFDLDSYKKGDLDFSIDPRPLIPETEIEKATTRKAYFDALQSAKDVGFPVEVLLEEDEWDQDVIDQYTEQQQANQMLGAAMFGQQQPGNTDPAQLPGANNVAQLPAGDRIPQSAQ